MGALTDIRLDEYLKLSQVEKGAYLKRDGRLFHVLFAQQFGREDLESLGRLATRIRFIAKTKEGMDFLRNVLSDKRAMLYFSQPSTRTFLSFCAACQILGITTGEVRDTSTSSELKGESREDSVRTFSSYFDLIIMRSEIGGLAERMAWTLSNTERPVPIINAGSGKDQHPTQALLDIYTLQRSFETTGGIDGKTIMFVGDLARGRTVRSLSLLLLNYSDVRQYFVAPEGYQIGSDILQTLDKAGVRYKLSSDFHALIPEADAIYMTRVQDEWDKTDGKPAVSFDRGRYSFGVEDLKRLKEKAVLMHPFPRRTEIDPAVDHDPRAVYWRQMRNGMWIRAALIATIFGREKVIDEHAASKV